MEQNHTCAARTSSSSVSRASLTGCSPLCAAARILAAAAGKDEAAPTSPGARATKLEPA